MDAQLGRTLRVGDQVLYRNAIHTVVAVAQADPGVYLDGVYAPPEAVPYVQLYLPSLLNPDAREDKHWPTTSS